LQEVLLPQYHWTNSKLRVNIFVCMVALTYLILFCQRLAQAGLLLTPREALEELRTLRTAVFWEPGEEKLKRKLASPNDLPITAAVLGLLASVVSSYLTIKYLLRFLQRHTFKPFAYYRLVLAALIITVSLLYPSS